MTLEMGGGGRAAPDAHPNDDETVVRMGHPEMWELWWLEGYGEGALLLAAFAGEVEEADDAVAIFGGDG